MIAISKYNKQHPLRVFEAFAGYGSQSLAFKYLKDKHPEFDFMVVGYSEIEPSAIIAEIQAEREADHIVPPHVLTAEIINRGFHQPYQTINELCEEGKIKWCRTLNDMAFTIRK